MGGPSAYALVCGPGFWPSVGSAMSRGVSRGVCGLRTSLGSLSADGWVYVPALLVV